MRILLVPDCVRVWDNARIATMNPNLPGLGVIEPGAIAARGEKILFVGPAGELPAFPNCERIDCQGAWITPGLVDCHTHLPFAGWRAQEYGARRLT